MKAHHEKEARLGTMNPCEQGEGAPSPHPQHQLKALPSWASHGFQVPPADLCLGSSSSRHGERDLMPKREPRSRGLSAPYVFLLDLQESDGTGGETGLSEGNSWCFLPALKARQLLTVHCGTWTARPGHGVGTERVTGWELWASGGASLCFELELRSFVMQSTFLLCWILHRTGVSSLFF